VLANGFFVATEFSLVAIITVLQLGRPLFGLTGEGRLHPVLQLAPRHLPTT